MWKQGGQLGNYYNDPGRSSGGPHKGGSNGGGEMCLDSGCVCCR